MARLKHREKAVAFFISNRASFLLYVSLLLTKNVLPGLLVSEKHVAPWFGSPAVLLADNFSLTAIFHPLT